MSKANPAQQFEHAENNIYSDELEIGPTGQKPESNSMYHQMCSSVYYAQLSQHYPIFFWTQFLACPLSGRTKGPIRFLLGSMLSDSLSSELQFHHN